MNYRDSESGRPADYGAPADEELGMGSFDQNDSLTLRTDTPSFKPSELDAYSAYDLIPLHPPKAFDRNGKSIGKAPMKGWRTQSPLSVRHAKAHMGEGNNVGVRLRDTDLVVDVDPRNFADNDDPLNRLGIELGIDWTDFPTVITGSGGKHIYMSKPVGLKLRDSVVGYKGIEFKSEGRQVVAAGSVHPDTGATYLWDNDPLAVQLQSRPSAPAALIDFAARPASSVNAVVGGDRSSEELEAMLAGLDPCEFDDHDRWLSIMMACHHATGGAGREEFIAWSIGDARYSDRADDIAARWNSLQSDRSGPKVTERTLFKALIDAGRRDLLPRATAREDFGIDSEDEAFSASRGSRATVVDDWVYVIDAQQFVRRSDGKKWVEKQWKAKYASLKPDGDVLSAIWRGAIHIRKYDALVYLPGDAEFPDGENGDRYNIWRKSGVEPKPGDVQPFLDHIKHLFADETERGYVLDFLAMLVQRPGEKVNFALLVKGGQGTGKSWIGRLMMRIIGERNVTLPSNTEVMSQWTVWTEGAQLGIIEELMALGRIDMANRLKPIITEPELRIESKGCNLYSIPNKLNLMAFTNHDDAVPIERGDRRWLVVFSDAERLKDDYYEKLWKYLNGDGPAAVKDWLLKRRVALNPKGMAPKTVGKDAMRRLSMGEAEQFLLELLQEEEAPFDFPLVKFDDVLAAVPHDIERRTKGLRGRVVRWLKEEAGAVKHSRYTKQDGSDRPNSTLWSIRDHDHWCEVGAAGRIDAFVNYHGAAIHGM